ncbi:hypothetical protein [Larkinella ripae]
MALSAKPVRSPVKGQVLFAGQNPPSSRATRDGREPENRGRRERAPGKDQNRTTGFRRTRGPSSAKKTTKSIPRPVKRNRMMGSRGILSGIDERKDSIRVVLDRVNRTYALSKSTLQAGTY